MPRREPGDADDDGVEVVGLRDAPDGVGLDEGRHLGHLEPLERPQRVERRAQRRDPPSEVRAHRDDDAAALLAALVLRTRNKVYRRIQEAETADTDADGIPDVYQDDTAVPPGARAVSG